MGGEDFASQEEKTSSRRRRRLRLAGGEDLGSPLSGEKTSPRRWRRRRLAGGEDFVSQPRRRRRLRLAASQAEKTSSRRRRRLHLAGGEGFASDAETFSIYQGRREGILCREDPSSVDLKTLSFNWLLSKSLFIYVSELKFMEPKRLGAVGETKPDDRRAMTGIVARVDPIRDAATSLKGSDDPDATTDISNSEVATVLPARIATPTRIEVSEEPDVPVADFTTPLGLDSTRFFDNADPKLPPGDVSKVVGPSATEITPPESWDGADIDVEGVAPKERAGNEDAA
ncbi:hypothetical protein AALP_AAs40007U000300 [Arabis alpina]|uniref:Uncharacterized protein n=1 Tax=Arabis alpina TaxID=50452 RepID=A0A087FZ05_ARAAL|nr:hypothetical protein AALP_AAs40007U000300 [Arabis alpina]